MRSYSPFTLKSLPWKQVATLAAVIGTGLLVATDIAHAQQAPATGTAPSTASTQPVPSRIAILDIQKVVNTSVAGKAATGKLNAMQDERFAKAQAMDVEITALDAEINKGKLTMEQAKLVEMQKQLSEKQTALDRYAQTARNEIDEAREKELGAFHNQMMSVIGPLALEEGVAAVFAKSDESMVYTSPAIDITDRVIQRLNAITPAPATVAPTPAATTPATSTPAPTAAPSTPAAPAGRPVPIQPTRPAPTP
jgi:outer membrane protein